ncbi:MAG: WD40 repeat domain-containing serine/threonine protein kinase, partial [Candidatus Xenobia bacterium]
MGLIFLARDERLGRDVAIKQLTASGDAAATQLFRKEADVLATLEHPHLVRVTDNFQEQGLLYLVMEYVPGETLTGMLARTPNGMPVKLVAEWTEQLLETLVYVHGKGVIVRDIKPDNLMLDSAGRIKLIDFGIARQEAAGSGSLARGMGTPGYAPVEQYGSIAVDGRADLYSLGATLYTLLTGVVPPPSVELAGGSVKLVDVAVANPNVPGPLSRVLRSMLALRREDRPASAAEALRALRQPQARQPGRRRVALLGGLLSGVVATAAAIGLAFTTHQLAQAPLGRLPVVGPVPYVAWTDRGVEVATENGDVIEWDGRSQRAQRLASRLPAPLYHAARSPDGKYLACSGADARQMAIVDLASGTAAPLQIPDTPSDLDYAQDGSRLAIVAGYHVQLCSVPDGAVRWELPLKDGAPQAVCWPGSRLVIACSDYLRELDPATGDTLHTWLTVQSKTGMLAASPDGGVLFAARDGGVQILDSHDGSQIRSLGNRPLKSMAVSPDGHLLAEGSSDGGWVVQDVQSGQNLLERTDRRVSALAWSPDGKALAVGGQSSDTKWDVTVWAVPRVTH